MWFYKLEIDPKKLGAIIFTFTAIEEIKDDFLDIKEINDPLSYKDNKIFRNINELFNLKVNLNGILEIIEKNIIQVLNLTVDTIHNN